MRTTRRSNTKQNLFHCLKGFIIHSSIYDLLERSTKGILYNTHCGNLLVKAFAGVMEKIFQHFGDLVEGEAGFPVPLLRRMVPRWTWCPGSPKQKLLLLILFEEQVVKEALLRHRPVKLLQTTVGEELAQVHTVVHKEAHKVRFVIDQCIHHHLFKVACLQRSCVFITRAHKAAVFSSVCDKFFVIVRFVFPLPECNVAFPVFVPSNESLVSESLSYLFEYKCKQIRLKMKEMLRQNRILATLATWL